MWSGIPIILFDIGEFGDITFPTDHFIFYAFGGMTFPTDNLLTHRHQNEDCVLTPSGYI